MKIKATISYSILVLVIALLTACRSPEAEKITSIPDKNASQMTDMIDSTGFQKGWINFDSIKKYSKVTVDVSISNNKIENSTFDNLNTRKAMASDDEDLKYVADYARESFDKAFANSTQFKIAEKPGKDVLKVNFIITQLVPNDAIVSTAGLIAGAGIGIIMMPIGLATQTVSTSTRGAIAAEIIVRDSTTGEILAVFASREKGAVTILFNTMDFTAYGNVRSIIDTWSKDVVYTLDQIKSDQHELKAAGKVDTVAIIQ